MTSTVNKLQYKRKRGHKTKIRASRNNLRKADFFFLMKEQNNLCASRDCAKNNDGVRQKVSSTNDMCFIIPVNVWEFEGRQGDPRKRSNRQLLCPTCHKIKITEDRKRIAKLKRAKT